MENGKRRARRQLSPEEKWEIFLEVTSQELSQADAARKWNVDVSVIIRLRALAKDAALAAFASAKPGARQPLSAESGTELGQRLIGRNHIPAVGLARRSKRWVVKRHGGSSGCPEQTFSAFAGGSVDSGGGRNSR